MVEVLAGFVRDVVQEHAPVRCSLGRRGRGVLSADCLCTERAGRIALRPDGDAVWV